MLFDFCMRFAKRYQKQKSRGFAHATGLITAFVFGILAALILPVASRIDSTSLKVVGWIAVCIAVLGFVRDWIVFSKIADQKRRWRHKKMIGNHLSDTNTTSKSVTGEGKK